MDWLHHPCRPGGPPQRGKIKKVPHVGGLAKSPLPFGGSRGQNQKWLTCGWTGYITPAIWGVTHKGANSEWADWLHHPCHLGGPHQGDYIKRDHKWADWLHHPCRLGVTNKWAKLERGPQVGGLATSPLPSRGSPTNGQNQKGTTCEGISYFMPAIWGVPNKGAKSEVAYM